MYSTIFDIHEQYRVSAGHVLVGDNDRFHPRESIHGCDPATGICMHFSRGRIPVIRIVVRSYDDFASLMDKIYISSTLVIQVIVAARLQFPRFPRIFRAIP